MCVCVLMCGNSLEESPEKFLKAPGNALRAFFPWNARRDYSWEPPEPHQSRHLKPPIVRRFLMGWCRWGQRDFPIFSFCFCFFFLRFSSLNFRFFFVFLLWSPRTRPNDCNLLRKWGISLRPRLHQPHSELPKIERN